MNTDPNTNIPDVPAGVDPVAAIVTPPPPEVLSAQSKAKIGRRSKILPYLPTIKEMKTHGEPNSDILTALRNKGADISLPGLQVFMKRHGLTRVYAPRTKKVL